MKIETRRVVHSALAAARGRVALDKPIDKTIAIAVAIDQVPLNVGAKLRIMTPQPFGVRGGVVHELDAVGEKRRLRDCGRSLDGG